MTNRCNNCVVEASSLAISPGRWPASIWFAGSVYRKTDVDTDAEGDVVEVRYADGRGNVLIVLND